MLSRRFDAVETKGTLALKIYIHVKTLVLSEKSAQIKIIKNIDISVICDIIK